MPDEPLSPEAAWAFLYDELLAALPVQYGVDVDAVGRALADIHPALLRRAAERVAVECERLPAPVVFRRYAAEAVHGRPVLWLEAVDRCIAYARWDAQGVRYDRDGIPDVSGRPPVSDAELDVMRSLGGTHLFVDPSDTLRAQFRDAWTARTALLLHERTAVGALTAPPDRPELDR